MSNNMKALVLHGINDHRLETVPSPKITNDSVLVEVAFCGVCGSDIPRIFEKGTYNFPTICGHEFAGTVVQCGSDVRNFKNGERVVVFPLIWCGKCSACEQGSYAQCSNYDYLGSRSDGGFAQYVKVPQRNLIRIPDSVSFEEASMTEPAAVALHALRRVGTSLVGKSAAIFGAGPIGLMLAQWAKFMGAVDIFIFDVVDKKLEAAKQLGFVHAFNSKTQDPVETINNLTHRKGAHVCIEAAGVPATLLASIAAAREKGTVILLGNPSKDVVLPAKLISQAMRREIALIGTWNSYYSQFSDDDDWRTVLSALANKQIDLKSLISHSVGLDNALQTLTSFKNGTEFFSKVLIHP